MKYVAMALVLSSTAVLAVDPLTREEIKEFYVTQNAYRCMHGMDRANYLKWSTCIGNMAQKYASTKPSEHSDSYTKKGCEGPSGENLGSGYSSISAVTAAWYNEEPLYDYSKAEYSPEAGHFTALIWKGAKELGCGKVDTSYVCNYRGDDILDCNTPNMRGCFTENVPKRDETRTKEDCTLLATQAFVEDDESSDVNDAFRASIGLTGFVLAACLVLSLLA